jgi:hypothetical protein
LREGGVLADIAAADHRIHTKLLTTTRLFGETQS